MNTSVNAAAQLGYGGAPVPPGEIEAALRRAYREAAASDAHQRNEPAAAAAARAKVTLSNLVLLSASWLSDSRTVSHLLESLCVRHPSRFFLLKYAAEKAGIEPLATAVSSRCVVAASGTHVCSEEVYCRIHDEAVPALTNLLLSLVIPDAPTVLLMGDDPCAPDAAALRNLVVQVGRLSDLIVVDSARFGSFLESQYFLRTLAKEPTCGEDVSQASLSSIGVSGCRSSGMLVEKDLQWRRLRPWRRSVAELFDGERSGDLPYLEEISCFASGDGLQIHEGQIGSSLYLTMGWICSRMGLNVESVSCEPDALAVQMNKPAGHQLRFVVTKEGQTSAGERLFRLCFRFRNAQQRWAVELFEPSDASHIEMRFMRNGTEPDATRRVNVLRESLEELVLGSLSSFAHDVEYEAAREKAIVIAAQCSGL